MGVNARLVFYAPSQKVAEDAGAAAFARIAALDSIMSDYRPASELMRLCAHAGGPPVKVSPDLFRALRRAQDVSKQSNGAFDITVGPVVALWRAARKSGKLPDAAELARARKLVGWQKVHLDAKARTVRLDTPGMKLDLGGIGKGYAADAAQETLKRHGVTRAMVEMGGDIVVSGPPPGTNGWTVRVLNAGSDLVPTDLHLVNTAISTSGDTEQFVLIGGKRYSHLVDPRTGQALTSRVQVSLIAPNGTTSDPLTKALSILSPEASAKLLQRYPGTKSYIRVISDMAADAEGWDPLWDGKSLKGWKRTPFSGGGEVKIDPNFRGGAAAIITEAGSTLSGFNWTGDAPRTNYEISLEFMKITGNDFACGLTFPVGEKYASLILGGWGGGVVGISSIDGQDASENPTTKYRDFLPDQWRTVRLKVTPEKIEAWLDEKQIVDQELADKRISLRAGEIDQSVPIGISTYQTSAAYRNIKLRRLPAGR